MPKKSSPLLKPLTGKRLKRELKAAGRLAVGPQLREARAERRTSRVQSRRIKDMFGELSGDIAKGAASTASAYSGASDKIASQAQSSQAFADQLRARMDSEARADAERRGVTYDDSGSQTNAAAQLARVNAANILSGVTASQGASAAANWQSRAATATQARNEQLLREQARRRSFHQEIQSLHRDKAATMLQERGRLRDSERDYHLGLLAAKDNKASRRFERKESRKSFQRQKKITSIQDRNERADDRRSRGLIKQNQQGGGDKGGDKGGYSVREAKALARSGVKLGKVNTRKERVKATDYLINRGVGDKRAKRVIRKLTRPKKSSGPQFDRFH